jgi:hypothetical protein
MDDMKNFSVNVTFPRSRGPDDSRFRKLEVLAERPPDGSGTDLVTRMADASWWFNSRDEAEALVKKFENVTGLKASIT